MDDSSDLEPLFSDSDTIVDATLPAGMTSSELEESASSSADVAGSSPTGRDTIAEPLRALAQPSKARTEKEIAALVQEGFAIVKPLAHKVARQVGRVTDFDELVSVGQSALFDAARSFDSDRSPFAPYATNKVRWAMIDSVRRQTHGRSAAARATALAALDRVVEASNPMPPNEAPQTDLTYQERLKKQLTLEAAALFVGLTANAETQLVTDPEESPEILLMRERAGSALRGALSSLPERHREIVERHYFGGERFDHIAESMGVSKSWLSRLHAQAIEALGEALREH